MCTLALYARLVSSFAIPVPILLMRPFLCHMAEFQRLNKVQKRRLNSEGVVTKKQRPDGTTAVNLGLIFDSHYRYSQPVAHAQVRPLQPSGLKLRTGGPKLRATQRYPPRFCRRVVQLYRQSCLESWYVCIACTPSSSKLLWALDCLGIWAATA